MPGRRAIGGRVVVITGATSAEMASIIVSAYGLSPREQEVSRLLAHGNSTSGIAAELSLSVFTVRDHIKSLFTKVGVASRGELVAPTDITNAFGAVVDLMRWAEQQLEQLSIKAASDESSSVTRQTTIEAILVLLVLIVAVALAILLARSLNLSLRRLREGALSVANRDLPEAVAQGRDTLILDNQVQAVLTDRDVVHYVPVFSLDRSHWWIHVPPT